MDTGDLKRINTPIRILLASECSASRQARMKSTLLVKFNR